MSHCNGISLPEFYHGESENLSPAVPEEESFLQSVQVCGAAPEESYQIQYTVMAHSKYYTHRTTRHCPLLKTQLLHLWQLLCSENTVLQLTDLLPVHPYNTVYQTMLPSILLLKSFFLCSEFLLLLQSCVLRPVLSFLLLQIPQYRYVLPYLLPPDSWNLHRWINKNLSPHHLSDAPAQIPPVFFPFYPAYADGFRTHPGRNQTDDSRLF